MGLTEKTLELNVTHELLALGHGIRQILWTWIPFPLAGISVIAPPIYAAGLSLQDELEHGWDVSLDLPAMGATPARVAFLQFKLGKSRRYSRYPGSKFVAPSSPQTAHVFFGINNNSERNQHSRLRRTGQASGMPDAAIYALPLFTNEVEVRKALGGLLANTAFFSVPGVDLATCHDPIVDGVARGIAIATNDPIVREVRSKPVPFEAQEIGGKLFGEIAAVRLHRAISELRFDAGISLEDRRAIGQSISSEMARFLANFVGADISAAQQAFNRDLRGPTARSVPAAPDRLDDDKLKKIRDKRILDVANVVLPILDRLDLGNWDEEISHPVETHFLAEASRDGVRLSFPMERRPTSSMRLSYIVI